MNKTYGKPYKEKDLASRTRMFGISAWVFPFLALIGLIGGYLYYGTIGAVLGIVAALVVSVLVAFGAMATTGSIGGSVVDMLYGRRRGLWSLREQLEGPLRQARTEFEAEMFEKALKVVNQVITKDPQYPEALVLKAQILWEGFHNAQTAKPYLLRAMALVPDEANAINLQAAGLLNDIKIYDGPTTHLPVSEGQDQIAALHRKPPDKRITAVVSQKARRQINRTGTDRFLLYGILIWGILMAGLLWRANTLIEDLDLTIRNTSTEATLLQETVQDQHNTALDFEETLQRIEKTLN
jgi:tetratricopeptide (TPR) repeat protein